MIIKYLLKVYRLPYHFYRIINRMINQRHAYDYSETNDGWKKYGNTPVYGNYSTGSMFDPYVCKINEIYYMFVSERKTGTIIRLDSINGMEWTNRIVCLSGTHGEEWNSIVNRCCVLVKDNLWHMWFSAQVNGRSTIGYAQSKDGCVFSIISSSPVLKAEEDYEGVSVMNPCVLWDKASHVFKMWYAAGENYEPDVICYAESIDGIIWKRCKYNPVLKPIKEHKYEKYKVGGCHVTKNDNGYMMYYIGYQNLDVARICEAYSDDGIHWIHSARNPILSPTFNSWDSDAVYKPTVVYNNDGSIYIWYNRRRSKNEYIGFVKKEKK